MTPETYVPSHLLIAPLLIPIVAGALMLFYDDKLRKIKLGIGLAAIVALFFVSLELISRVKGDALGGGETIVATYLLGDWPVPIGIVLVVDRLSAMMVMLTTLIAAPALIYAAAGWQGKGQHFHTLFQLLLAGVIGAFLTGDLFNLFVFFEVMLAASYGLMLHGSGPERIKQGLHYIAINLAASLLFLIGAALAYGTTGTLNMADMSRVVPLLDPAQRMMFHAAAAFLGLAFLTKAAIWPLCFWLPSTYAAASPPAAASFAIMTKVGLYVLLRLATLLFGHDAGISAGFGGPVLILGGMATIAYGMFGVLGAQGVAIKGGYIALISSGTVLSAVGISLIGGGTEILSGALFYLIGSTVAISAYFLLAEPVGRGWEGKGEDDTQGPDPVAERWAPMMGTVEDETAPASDRTAPWSALGFSFALIAAILAGLPPFPGFIGKVAMLSGAFHDNTSASGAIPTILWVYAALLILSGFAVLVSLVRLGIRRFWASGKPPERMLALEIVPVFLILAMLVLQTVKAGPLLNYTHATALDLAAPAVYRNAVLSAPVVADSGGSH
ncbi:monovalent cation/H+ antiporter subunit D [Paracoccus aminophilus]|uniref:Multicomponent K+:H+ antiporter, subunit D n=1 Tax=Paracoccus aminophilus JCM 7686 TaxID=1367847 RepID=S5XU07_PARAH|nr:monovalent cation/H+ antiporter subunit D [Paracoccus aminophilus]AGT08662.1 multicomponent K+:H+ antiporter, subunit D [Paracoccus aminophilus JCM 7686]